jgi:hypothetical protein
VTQLIEHLAQGPEFKPYDYQKRARGMLSFVNDLFKEKEKNYLSQKVIVRIKNFKKAYKAINIVKILIRRMMIMVVTSF